MQPVPGLPAGCPCRCSRWVRRSRVASAPLTASTRTPAASSSSSTPRFPTSARWAVPQPRRRLRGELACASHRQRSRQPGGEWARARGCPALPHPVLHSVFSPRKCRDHVFVNRGIGGTSSSIYSVCAEHMVAEVGSSRGCRAARVLPRRAALLRDPALAAAAGRLRARRALRGSTHALHRQGRCSRNCATLQPLMHRTRTWWYWSLAPTTSATRPTQTPSAAATSSSYASCWRCPDGGWACGAGTGGIGDMGEAWRR